MSKDQKEICGYCVAFAKDRENLYNRFQCRRHAPTAQGWPHVREDDWCLEFTERRDDHGSEPDTFQPIGDIATNILSRMKIEQ
jgi:hypothetical protein